MINGIYSFQKKSIHKFNDLLKDKSIVSIKKENDWYLIEYENKQIFKIKGFVVDHSNIYEGTKIIKKRLF